MEIENIDKDTFGDIDVIESECSTVPTDLTVSADSETNRLLTVNISLDRKSLIQELHLLKIELSKKNLLLQNLKADFTTKVEELEEKYADAVHQKEMFKIRMESQLSIKEGDWKMREEKLKTEINTLNEKIKIIDNLYQNTRDDIDYLMKHLNNSLLNDKQIYSELKEKTDSLTFREKILLTCFEFALYYKNQTEELEEKLKTINKEFLENKEQLQKQKEISYKFSHEYTGIQEKYLNAVQELADTKSQIQYGNYAKENFARVKEERDKLQIEILDLRELLNNLQANNTALINERDDLKNDILRMRHQQAILQQEREQLGNQLTEITQQWGEAQDRASQLMHQLERAKQAHESMLSQFINAREKFKIEYDEKLKHEMDQIRSNTNQEVQKLKNHMNLFYEREIRSLQESRDAIFKQKEEMEVTVKKTQTKYEELSRDLQKSHLHGKTAILELQSEIKQKNYELDKLLEIQKENSLKLQDQQLENEKLAAKLEAVNIELQLLQQKQILSEQVVENKIVQLEQYKKLEKDLDEISLQISKDNAEDEPVQSLAEKLLRPSSLRKLQQNANLFHQIIELEKKIELLNQKLNDERKNKEKLQNELIIANNLVNFTKRPHSLVMDTIREKEVMIQQLHQEIFKIKQQKEELSENYYKLENSNKKLLEEMEKIRNNREELGKVKQLLITLHQDKEIPLDKETKVIKIAPPNYASIRNTEEII